MRISESFSTRSVIGLVIVTIGFLGYLYYSGEDENSIEDTGELVMTKTTE